MQLALDIDLGFGEFRLRVRGDYRLDGVTALFGPSGAGKSTLLDVVGGFRPGAGRVALDGELFEDATTFVPPWQRHVGRVFQDARLFTHLSVADNLDYAVARQHRRAPAHAEVVEVAGLGGLLHRMPATLSGGEQKRVATARALLTGPKLLLMDEPLAGLDRRAGLTLLELIGRLPERFGIPVIYVSHQIEELAELAGRMLAIDSGRIVAEGPLADVLDTLGPAVVGHFEAGSLVRGVVRGRSDDYAMLEVDLGPGSLWLPASFPAETGETVQLRLRSRDVAIAVRPLADVSIRNQIPVRIVDITPEASAYAEVRLDCGGQTLRARLTRLAVDELALSPGLDVYALIKSVAFDRRRIGARH